MCWTQPTNGPSSFEVTAVPLTGQPRCSRGRRATKKEGSVFRGPTIDPVYSYNGRIIIRANSLRQFLPQTDRMPGTVHPPRSTLPLLPFSFFPSSPLPHHHHQQQQTLRQLSSSVLTVLISRSLVMVTDLRGLLNNPSWTVSYACNEMQNTHREYKHTQLHIHIYIHK